MFSGILDRHLAARFLSNAGAIMAREPLLAPFPGTVPPPLEMPSDSMMAREPLLAPSPGTTALQLYGSRTVTGAVSWHHRTSTGTRQRC